MKAKITPVHQWTNGGDEVLIVRFVDKDFRSSSKRLVNGRVIEDKPFQHPLSVGERVTAPDWTPTGECGGGIHGWPWAMSLGDGTNCDWTAPWLVYGVKPEDVVNLSGKVKFKTGILRHIGTWQSATNLVLPGQMAWVHHASSGAASATGSSGAASATGSSGAASATGESGAASATGSSGAAVVTGTSGKARAGEFGCIALAWWNAKKNRAEMRCALVGKNRKLKPGVWYRLNSNGRFAEVK